MPIMLEIIIKIGKRSNALYMGVYFIAINNNKYHVYAANPP